jgi:hypothetical protein
MNRHGSDCIRKWPAYFSAHAAKPGDIYLPVRSRLFYAPRLRHVLRGRTIVIDNLLRDCFGELFSSCIADLIIFILDGDLSQHG